MIVFNVLCMYYIFLISFCLSICSFGVSITIIPISDSIESSVTEDVFLTTLNTTDVLQELRYHCCNENDYDSYCTRKKCYYVIEEELSFLTARTICTKEYVRWERLADAATFQEKEEMEDVQSLLSHGQRYWIGGMSCPQSVAFPIVQLPYNETWVNGESIPNWLKRSYPKDVSSIPCMYLSIEYNGSISKFEPGIMKHPVLCELKVPDPHYREETTIEITLENTNSTMTTPSFVNTQPQTQSLVTSPFTDTTVNEQKGWCKERIHKNIFWPSTPGGKQAEGKCPNGTVGIATWMCDAKTSQFILEPNMMKCISNWFDNIQNEIKAGKDTLDIAKKLANKTKEENLQLGDLTGIIDTIGLLNKKFDNNSDYSKRKKYGKAIVQIGSNLLYKQQHSSWNTLHEGIRLKSANKLLLQIQTIGRMISCKEKEYLNDDEIASDNILLQSFTFTQKAPYVFPRSDKTIGQKTNCIHIPSGLSITHSYVKCGSFPTGYGILYNELGPHLSIQENNDRQINSMIISFAYGEGQKSITLPPDKELIISLEHTKVIENGEPRCVFWNFTTLKWEDTGCWKIGGNKTHTECKCSHLTNFAVLMDLSGDIRSSTDPVMKYLSIVCCGLSSVSLIFTISCLIGFRTSHNRRNTITCNLAFCLLVVNLLILFGVKRTEIQIICRIIAGALHYSALASFCWMLLEAYHLYQMVIVVFEKINAIKMRWFCIFAYGVPLLIVLPSVLLRPYSYSDSHVCWLSAQDNMIWVFAGPVALILLINTIVLVLALQSARNVKMKKQKTKAKNLVGWIKGSFSLMSLLGITWIIGFVNLHKGILELSYIFIILNGLQGCFIMIFHVIINEKVRGCFIMFITRAQFSGKGFRSSLQTTTSSRNPLHSQRQSESSKRSPMYFSNPRRISVSPASTTYTGHI